MTILQIIAIAGVLIGMISIGIEICQKGKKSYGLYIALIIISVALFFVSTNASKTLNARKQAQLAQTEAPAMVEDAEQKADSMDAPAKVDDGEPLDAPLDLSDEDMLDLSDDDDETAPEAAEVAPEAAEIADVAPDAEVAEAAPEAVAEAAEAEVAPEAAEVVPEAAAAPEAAEVAPEAAAAPEAAPVPVVVDNALAPKAVAGAPIDDAKINESIDFSCKKSKKNRKGGAIVSYKWDFGDGSTSEECETKHAYGKVGTYIASLTVTDANGQFGVDTRQIDVVRPERRITFVEKKLPDLNAVSKSPDAITGTFQKTFTGSKLYLEASSFILAGDGCDCELIVSLNGPGCTMTKRKKVSNGGEGDVSVKAVCHAEVGEHTWTVERKVSNGCTCTFTGSLYEGSES